MTESINKTIVFGLLAKDCVENLRRNIPKVEEFGQMFKDYNIIVYENDSTDGTTKEVEDWKIRNKRVLAICDHTTPDNNTPISNCPYPAKSIHRIQKMCNLRNRILEETERNFTPDLFCFIDADIFDFSPQEIINAIKKAPEDWGGLFANGIVYWYDELHNKYIRPFQYDSYAYVEKDDDYTKRGLFVVGPDFHPKTAYQMMLDINANEYLSCESAFNGIGIYQYEAIRHERYSPLQNDELKEINASLCEHISFNRKVRQKGYSLYIAREIKVTYQQTQMADIVSDIVYDYQGILDKTGLLQPGLKCILNSWKEQRETIHRLKQDIIRLEKVEKELQTFKNKPCIQTRDYCENNKLYRRMIISNLHIITWIEMLRNTIKTSITRK